MIGVWGLIVDLSAVELYATVRKQQANASDYFPLRFDSPSIPVLEFHVYAEFALHRNRRLFTGNLIYDSGEPESGSVCRRS